MEATASEPGGPQWTTRTCSTTPWRSPPASGPPSRTKQAPTGPVYRPTFGLRAGKVAVPILEQITLTKGIPMWFRSLSGSPFARTARTPAGQRHPAPKGRRSPSSFRPRLDILEDRTLLSSYMVNSLTDTGAGSGLTGDLRYCITHGTSGIDTINFGVTGSIMLKSALPALNTSVAIQGPGARLLSVEGDPFSVSSFGIFAVGSAATVQISGLTMKNGNACAINNAGMLTVNDSTLTGNSGISYGGAIYNTGALTVSNSTITGNNVNAGPDTLYPNSWGGGIYQAGGRLSLSSSTLSNNTAYGGSIFYPEPDYPSPGAGFWIGQSAYGGGLYVAGGTVSIDHSTIAGNQALTGHTDYVPSNYYWPGDGVGGGIVNNAGQSALQVYDTILAGNVASYASDYNGSVAYRASDLYGSFASLGHDLIGNSSGGSGFAATDLLNVNPQLGPLQNNGGPTETMALLAGSPAINAGDNTSAPAYDQRGPGFPRIVGGTIDIGAFEVQTAVAPLASSFAVSGFPASTTAGVAGSFTVTAKNADGTTATGYTGTVHFSSSDGQAGLPANYAFTATDGGMHTFNATLKTAGTQSITSTDASTSTLTGGETGITVNPAAASTMTVTGFPSTTTAGVAGNFTVTLKDTFGNIASGCTGTAQFTSSDGKASLPANYTFTAADAGVHTFGATLKTTGIQSITAKDTVTGTIAGTEGGITVKPAAASQFILSAPSTVTAGVAFSLTVTVKDAFGNAVTGYTGTVHFTSTDGSATLPANSTFTAADNGMHTFTRLVLRKKGYQKLTITDTLNGSLTGSVIENVV